MEGELLGIAEGAESEAVKLQAVRDALDRARVPAKAEVSVELKPWERLMGDIAGIATISRAEHHARYGVLPDQSPAISASAEFEIVDAEVVSDPNDEDGPELAAPFPLNELRAPKPADLPAEASAPPTEPVTPPPGTVTYEEAADVMHQFRTRSNPVWPGGPGTPCAVGVHTESWFVAMQCLLA